MPNLRMMFERLAKMLELNRLSNFLDRFLHVVFNSFVAMNYQGSTEQLTTYAFLVGAFRRKTQTIVVTFFKTNELTDFINFIS